MAQDPLVTDPKARLRFETLLDDVSSRFVKLPPGKIDPEIRRALEEAAMFFGADRCALLTVLPDGRVVRATHGWSAEGIEQMPQEMDLAAQLPWSHETLIDKGQPVLFEKLAQLPPEAEQDRQAWVATGIRSCMYVPLFIGKSVRHLLVYQNMRGEQALPEAYVPLLRLFGRVLVNALEHGQEVEALQRAMEERLSFETTLAEISARFVNLPAEQMDGEIEGFQRFLCERLELDICSLWQWSVENPPHFRLTHVHRPPGSPPMPERFNAEEFFPWALEQMRAGRYLAVCAEHAPPEAARDQETWRQLGIKSSVCFPLSVGGGRLIGALSFDDMHKERAWPESIIQRLQVFAQAFANALARRQADDELKKSYEEIKQLKNRLQLESAYLQTEIKSVGSYGEIVGQSGGIQEVLAQVEQVSRTDSAVLITGETGTGKELIARAIHSSSKRRDRPMVVVNCASLPAGLVESELFGREKGAYTGALTKQVGRFEIADGSTLFLDEIAEIPLELQAKLLRVLEDGKFERLGSPKTIRADVRVIAATHHDLSEEVRNGIFREDLYYRINVFPIEVPPLRERIEDVPTLVWTFVHEFAERMGKGIRSIPKKSMDALQEYPWPGNIRELRNVIEHAVILSPGDVLHVKVPRTKSAESSRILTRREMERQHILEALERTGWRIKGPDGAAEKLGMKPTTLHSMLNRLGIPRPPK